MNLSDPNAAMFYAEYKQQWDALSLETRQAVDSAIPPDPTSDRLFNTAYTMGFNEGLKRVMGLLSYSKSVDPENKEVLATYDIVSFIIVRLFLIQYEITLLEQASTEITH